MSLQLAAQHMASRGRGPDSALVHMAPQEVAGLQALAKAHGGSLTTNPDTGLPEAGFLSSILPTLVGVGLSVASGGALTPLMAAGITGAGYGIATGSLQKGLMAGMGAYGGAGLASGLMGAGAGAAQQAAMAGVPDVASAGLDAGMGVYPEPSVLGAANTGVSGAALGSTAANPTGIPGFTGSTVGLTPAPSAIQAQQAVMQAAPQTVTAAPEVSRQALLNEAAARATPGTELFKTAGGSSFDTAKAGFGELMKRPEDFMTKENMKYGLAAASPLLFQEPERMAARPADKPYVYSYDAGRVADPQAGYTGPATGERTYFNPVYTRTAAGGGLMDIGPVQAMSDRNQAEAMLANGGIGFAEGGETKAVRPVEQDPYYTMSGQSGDAFKYLMGQGAKPTPAAAPVVAAPVQSTVQAAPVKDEPMDMLDFFKSGKKAQQQFLINAFTGNQDQGASTNSFLRSNDTTMRPYTFDPVTGGFTAMPVTEPVAAYSGPSVEADGLRWANGGLMALAQGGQSHLGDYSDGGRLLRGPGDGVSDSIPASIGNKRPARLADGEFVVPARIVSELGNGSTEAGARKLYAMMDRVQKARSGTVGKGRVAVNSKSDKLLPA